MNRDQFEAKIEKGKNANGDDGDKEYYFDCTILDKLQSVSGGQEEIKADAGIDLMEYISKSDFSTVGGQKQNTGAEFDFDSFNSQA